jgi:magnesium transporter
MFRLHAFHRTTGHWEEPNLSRLATLRADKNITVWLDLFDPTDDEAAVLSSVFNFHPLAIEDALQEYGHPKIESFDDHFFCVFHGVDLASFKVDESLTVATLELDVFFGERYLVTHHTHPMRSVDLLHESVCKEARRPWTSVRLLHQLLDELVDIFLPIMDRVGQHIEQLEDHVIHDPTPRVLERILAAKMGIMKLRRITHHQRSILETLARGHLELMPVESIAFFRDVYDHFVNVADLAESYRDAVQGTMEAYLSVTSNRMNEIMKVLTMMSTVMLPLTFIAGVYGMNFHHMPELDWKLGYPLALSLMAGTAMALFWYFKRKRWL